jgi:hypothetical protein
MPALIGGVKSVAPPGLMVLVRATNPGLTPGAIDARPLRGRGEKRQIAKR